MTATTTPETRIEADPKVPLVRIVREFDASPSKVYRAHVEPDLFARWTGPDGVATTVDRWDARSGGSYRYIVLSHGVEQGFNGTFHELRPDQLIVQTFSWEGMPDGVALEKLRFEPLDGGRRTRLVATSIVDSFEDRDAFLQSGMESGVIDGYAKLDALLATD
jgi:uncharacterized protein YndB with AHSA1/START domain